MFVSVALRREVEEGVGSCGQTSWYREVDGMMIMLDGC
jgi:hypothetical protein